jgi:hypothetical protein
MGRVVIPPTIDTKEAAKAMQLASVLTDNPMLTGKGVKVGVYCLYRVIAAGYVAGWIGCLQDRRTTHMHAHGSQWYQ